MRKKIVRSYKIDPVIKDEFDALARRIAQEVPKMDMGDVVGGALLLFASLSEAEQIEWAKKTWDYSQPAKELNHDDTTGTTKAGERKEPPARALSVEEGRRLGAEMARIVTEGERRQKKPKRRPG